MERSEGLDIFIILIFFCVKTVLEQGVVVTGVGWGCNSRLFLSSFIAAGKKNIMTETNFNRKSNFISHTKSTLGPERL